MRLIPAIDLHAGHCVRLLQGDFAAETRYDAEPLALLAQVPRLGADWLHVVDLDGARDGSSRQSRAHRASSPRSRASSCRWAAVCATPPPSTQLLDARRRARSHRQRRAHQSRTQVRTLAQALRARAHRARLRCAPGCERHAAASPRMAGGSNRRCRCGTRSRHFASAAAARAVHRCRARRRADGTRTSSSTREALRRFPQIAWQASGGIRDAARPAGAGRHAARRPPSAARRCSKSCIPVEELRPFLPNA